MTNKTTNNSVDHSIIEQNRKDKKTLVFTSIYPFFDLFSFECEFTFCRVTVRKF